jgi:hypothetical protein
MSYGYLMLTEPAIAGTTEWRKPNDQMKTLSALIILSAAAATPLFAQDAGVLGPGSRYGFEPQPGPTYHGRAS